MSRLSSGWSSVRHAQRWQVRLLVRAHTQAASPIPTQRIVLTLTDHSLVFHGQGCCNIPTADVVVAFPFSLPCPTPHLKHALFAGGVCNVRCTRMLKFSVLRKEPFIISNPDSLMNQATVDSSSPSEHSLLGVGHQNKAFCNNNNGTIKK